MHSTSSSENQTVVRYFAVTDAEGLRRMLVEFFRAPQLAADVGADLNVILAPRLLVEHRVVADDLVYLQRDKPRRLAHSSINSSEMWPTSS